MHMSPEQQWVSEEDQFAAVSAETSQPEEAQQPEAQQQAPADEPFEGFSQLPEPVKARFTETFEQSKKLEQELQQQRRQYGALAGRVPALQRQVEEFKKRTAAAPSSAQAPMSAEAWEKFKASFPQDAEAIEQALALKSGELAGKLDPLASELKELKEWREQVQQEMQEAENAEIVEYLDESVPDWKVIAGWEKPDGTPGDRTWHPEFEAWKDSLPAKIRERYDEALGSRDPDDIVFVMNAFKRDYLIALQEEGEQPAPQSRRQQTIRDVMPSGGASGIAERPTLPGYMSEEEQYAAAVARYRTEWQHQR